MAQMDLQRIHLQRVQYEQDYETSLVNLRTAKITMLMLLNARTPIDQFDVTGRSISTTTSRRWNSSTTSALADRPDLRAAMQAVDKAETDHKLAVSEWLDRSDVQCGFWPEPAHHDLLRRGD